MERKIELVQTKQLVNKSKSMSSNKQRIADVSGTNIES